MNWTKVAVVGKTFQLLEGPDAGKVLSYGPAGWEPPRSTGSSGPYENCTMSGGFAKYEPPPIPTIPNPTVGIFPFQTFDSGLAVIAVDDPQ